MRKDSEYTLPAPVHRLTAPIATRSRAIDKLGDPTRRIIDVYVPAGHDGKRLPLLVDLVGFTAGGPAHTNWKNFGENAPERLSDRRGLIGTGAMPPCVVAFPDCFTKLGGNQYVNSSAIGNWDDYLLKEAVPFVEQKFSCGGFGKRGVFGKSSGGYGAMVHALLHPDFWSAAASHSGDMGFPLMYGHEFVPVLRALAKNGGDIGKWIDDFWAAPKIKDPDVPASSPALAQAASFDPDPTAPYGLRLPVTHDTCEFIEEGRWNNWLDHGTVHDDGGNTRRGAEGAQRPPYRLRRHRPVQPRLWRTAHAPRTRENWRRARVRGIPRRPFLCRLPHGHQPANSGEGAERITGRK